MRCVNILEFPNSRSGYTEVGVWDTAKKTLDIPVKMIQSFILGM